MHGEAYFPSDCLYLRRYFDAYFRFCNGTFSEGAMTVNQKRAFSAMSQTEKALQWELQIARLKSP
jgi:hypothetical protein